VGALVTSPTAAWEKGSLSPFTKEAVPNQSEGGREERVKEISQLVKMGGRKKRTSLGYLERHLLSPRKGEERG